MKNRNQASPQSVGIDPTVRARLDAVAKAYRSVPALTMHIRVRASTGSREEIQDGTLQWIRPDRLRLTIATGRGERFVLANGPSRLESRDGRQRRTDGIRAERRLLDALSSAEFFGTPILPNLLSLPNASATLLPGNIVRLGRGNDEIIDASRAEVVVADVTTPSGPARITLAWGIDDLLLRRVHVHTRRGGGVLDISEHYTAVQITPAPPPSVFEMSPPPTSSPPRGQRPSPPAGKPRP